MMQCMYVLCAFVLVCTSVGDVPAQDPYNCTVLSFSAQQESQCSEVGLSCPLDYWSSTGPGKSLEIIGIVVFSCCKLEHSEEY